MQLREVLLPLLYTPLFVVSGTSRCKHGTTCFGEYCLSLYLSQGLPSPGSEKKAHNPTSSQIRYCVIMFLTGTETAVQVAKEVIMWIDAQIGLG